MLSVPMPCTSVGVPAVEYWVVEGLGQDLVCLIFFMFVHFSSCFIILFIFDFSSFSSFFIIYIFLHFFNFLFIIFLILHHVPSFYLFFFSFFHFCIVAFLLLFMFFLFPFVFFFFFLFSCFYIFSSSKTHKKSPEVPFKERLFSLVKIRFLGLGTQGEGVRSGAFEGDFAFMFFLFLFLFSGAQNLFFFCAVSRGLFSFFSHFIMFFISFHFPTFSFFCFS